jgi:hypothetical protein
VNIFDVAASLIFITFSSVLENAFRAHVD